MGLSTAISTAIIKAFDGSLADAVKVVSLVQVASVYNVTTGVTVDTETVTASRGVAELVNEEHVDGEVVLISDMSFLILQEELAVIPKVSDLIRIGTVDYIINLIQVDPADVTWNLIGREV